MYNEYDHVRIVSTGITGIILDKFQKDGRTLYTVESDKKGVAGGAGEEDSWKRFVCSEKEIELI